MYQIKLNSGALEILSSSAIGPHSVVVRAADGKLRGLGLPGVKQLWQQEWAVPRLSLRGTAQPTIARYGDLRLRQRNHRSCNLWPVGGRSNLGTLNGNMMCVNYAF